jgi:hypothetical protein
VVEREAEYAVEREEEYMVEREEEYVVEREEEYVVETIALASWHHGIQDGDSASDGMEVVATYCCCSCCDCFCFSLVVYPAKNYSNARKYELHRTTKFIYLAEILRESRYTVIT